MTAKKSYIKGIFLILSSALFFALMNLFVRLSGNLPTMQKCFFRNIIAFCVALAIFLRSGEKFIFTRKKVKDLIIRSSAGTAGLVCNYFAIDHMNISDATMLNKMSPFFAILMSALILKEKIKKLDLIFVLIAFCGAMFVIKPSFKVGTTTALIGIIGGMMSGIAYTYVRKLGLQEVPKSFIVMFFSGFSCLVCVPFVIADHKTMTTTQIMFMLLAGCAASVAQFCITGAYSNAPARKISVFEYSQVIFVAILGFFFLTELPDIYSIAGYIIIIGTAVLKCYAEKLSAQRVKISNAK